MPRSIDIMCLVYMFVVVVWMSVLTHFMGRVASMYPKFRIVFFPCHPSTYHRLHCRRITLELENKNGLQENVAELFLCTLEQRFLLGQSWSRSRHRGWSSKQLDLSPVLRALPARRGASGNCFSSMDSNSVLGCQDVEPASTQPNPVRSMILTSQYFKAKIDYRFCKQVGQVGSTNYFLNRKGVSSHNFSLP